jgi:hypothetical protein
VVLEKQALLAAARGHSTLHRTVWAEERREIVEEVAGMIRKVDGQRGGVRDEAMHQEDEVRAMEGDEGGRRKEKRMAKERLEWVKRVWRKMFGSGAMMALTKELSLDSRNDSMRPLQQRPLTENEL